MSWILDVIILLIIGFTVYFATKNGFVKTAMSMLSFALAVLITALLVTPVTNAFMESSLGDSVTEKIAPVTEQFVRDTLSATELDSGVVDNAVVEKLCSVTGIDPDELLEKLNDRGDAADTAVSIIDKVTSVVVRTVVTVIAAVIIFVISLILLFIATRVLDKVAKLPFLKSANKLLGFALGVVLALVRICLFCGAVKLLMDYSPLIGNDFISSLDAEKTLLFGIFSGINIFGFVF